MTGTDDCRITLSTNTQTVERTVFSGLAQRHVSLGQVLDDDMQVVDLLRSLLQEGGCIGIVRNTVKRAQTLAAVVQELLDVEVVLVHSRFLAVDRIKREAHLRRLLGPPGPEVSRPHALVVIGTQVLEQSLDVDFDALISDLAPVDLLLQRIGRLHRHDRERPSSLQEAACYVTGCDWSCDPPKAIAGSQSIYGQSAMLRTLGVLRQRWNTGLELPDDIAGLVAAAYEPLRPPGPDAWAPEIIEADEQRARTVAESVSRAHSFLLSEPFQPGEETICGLLEGAVGEARDDTGGAAQVRDTEDSIEVILVHDDNGQLRMMPGNHPASGRSLSADFEPDQWVARNLAGYTVPLPMEISRGRHGDGVIDQLEAASPPAWQQSHWLRGQLILTLDQNLEASVGEYHVRYDSERGLEHEKAGDLS
ncbi:MAG: CRISPR-associated helicase Cas3' [Actinomycetales bacterium]